MRRLIIFAGLLSAAGAVLIGMAYRFAAMTDPNGHGLAKASEIRSKATRDGSFLALAKVGFPEVIPLSRSHNVGEPVALLSDGRPIELPYRSLFPFVGDLDGDGRDELLLGTPDSGRLKVFPILGSRGRRVLGAPSWFDEKVPDGRIPNWLSPGEFSPQLADFDGDGRLDLLSGSNCCDPYGLHLFRRRADGSFEPRRHLEVDAPREDREIPTHRSRPFVTDWDSDGRPDLLFTTTKASCPYVGTLWPDDDEPMPMRRIDLPGPPRRITGNLAVADWDGDGLADLLLSQWHEREFGRISWFRNVGRPGQPRYEEGRTLVPGTEGPPYASGFCVVDWDGDCQLDLLVARVEYHQGPSKPKGQDVCGRLWLYPHGVGDRPHDADSLGERRPLEVEGKPLIVDDYAAFPAIGDLDGDGRPDLLLGDPNGFLKVYRNVGGPGRLRLTAPVRFGEFCGDERIPTG